VVCPIAGGSLLTRIDKAFGELRGLGLVAEGEACRIHGVQPAGCNPVVAAWRSSASEPKPVKPATVVHSLAVGDPPDGARALEVIRRTEGRADDPSDDESLEGVRLLARTEGLLAETAGGTVVAGARRLAATGAFSDGRPVVLVITGHGLKTMEAFEGADPVAATIEGTLDAWDALWKTQASVLDVE
jgi:threonine synthase